MDSITLGEKETKMKTKNVITTIILIVIVFLLNNSIFAVDYWDTGWEWLEWNLDSDIYVLTDNMQLERICYNGVGIYDTSNTGFIICGDLFSYTDVCLWSEDEYSAYQDLLGIVEATFLQEWEWTGAPGTAPGGYLSLYVTATDWDYFQDSWVERGQSTSSTAETYAFGCATTEVCAVGGTPSYHPNVGRVYSPLGEVDENGSYADLMLCDYEEEEIEWYYDTPIEEDNEVRYTCALGFEEDIEDYEFSSGIPYFYALASGFAGSYSEASINTEEGEQANTWSVQKSNVENFWGAGFFVSK